MSASTLTPLASYPLPKASPSLRYNNLSTATADGTVVYASGNAVLRYTPSSAVQSTLATCASTVTCVHAAPPAELAGTFSAYAPLLVATGATFVEVLVSGSVMSSVSLPNTVDGIGGGACAAVTPIAGTDSVSLVVGTTTGCTMFLELDLKTAKPGAEMRSTTSPVNAHEQKCVTAADIRHCADNDKRIGAFAVTGDATGRAVLWNYDRQPYLVIPVHTADCVTSVRICNEHNLLVAIAYGSGKINLHSAVSGALETSIAAHSRWITGLAYSAARGGLLASCAEDSVISLWSLPAACVASEAETKQNAREVVDVKHIGSAEMENWLPTGIAISADGASSLSVACYDNPTLRVFSIP